MPLKPDLSPDLQGSESSMQRALINWWAYAHQGFGLPQYALMAFPLQGLRTARNGARMKAEGMRAGTPDLFLAVPRCGLGGLWIEMKTMKGILTPAQKDLQLFLSINYAHTVCRSVDKAREVIEFYLK